MLLWASLVAQMVNNQHAMPGDPGLIRGSGRTPGNGNGNMLQYSCLENFVDRGAWQAIYSPWCCKELDMTGRLILSLFQYDS